VIEQPYTSLEDVIQDPVFPDVDLALRRGRHIDLDESEWFAFLAEAQSHLELFYRRFGCELIRVADGYFYLLPSGDRLGRRQLSRGEMLVGQGLALLYLDPATVKAAGVVPLALALLETLSDLAGLDNPLALSKVWRNPWPLPALAWHFAALGVAALYAYRRPLLAFGIILFYLGHLLESSILCLEVVYEHRMYLPSLGLALVFVLLLHEARAERDSVAPRRGDQ